MASDGGPGAMEPAHLGAPSAMIPVRLLSAIDQLQQAAPAFPKDGGKVIGTDGKIDRQIVKELHAWIMLANRLSQMADREKEYTDNVLITDGENEAVGFIIGKALAPAYSPRAIARARPDRLTERTNFQKSPSASPPDGTNRRPHPRTEREQLVWTSMLAHPLGKLGESYERGADSSLSGNFSV